jgi:hypothetical protein
MKQSSAAKHRNIWGGFTSPFSLNMWLKCRLIVRMNVSYDWHRRQYRHSEYGNFGKCTEPIVPALKHRGGDSVSLRPICPFNPTAVTNRAITRNFEWQDVSETVPLPRHLLMRLTIFDTLTRLAARSRSCVSTPLCACIYFVSPGACQLLSPIQTARARPLGPNHTNFLAHLQASSPLTGSTKSRLKLHTRPPRQRLPSSLLIESTPG